MKKEIWVQSATVFFLLLNCFSNASDLFFILDLFVEFLPTHNNRIFVLWDFFVGKLPALPNQMLGLDFHAPTKFSRFAFDPVELWLPSKEEVSSIAGKERVPVGSGKIMPNGLE